MANSAESTRRTSSRSVSPSVFAEPGNAFPRRSFVHDPILPSRTIVKKQKEKKPSLIVEVLVPTRQEITNRSYMPSSVQATSSSSVKRCVSTL